MTYYDEDFKPWEIVDGQCVVADEAEWGKLLEWDLLRSKFPKGDRTIFKLTTDIFEDVEGQFFDQSLKPMFTNEHITTQRPLTVSDLLTRFLLTVDLTPHVDYLVVTQRPELVREKWPYESETATEQLIGRPEKHVVEVKRHFKTMPNVILTTYVETQSDIERLVPELLKCHDLCKGMAVVCNPKEKLDFREVNLGTSADNYFYVDSLAGDWVQEDVGDRENPPSTMCHDDGPSLNLIIAEGNEHPIHPQWLRSLRDQCLDEDVPFNFAGWGEWHPLNGNGIHDRMDDSPERTPYTCLSRDGTTSQSGLPPDKIMIQVGKERSGRLLDGQEHNGRME